MYYKIKNVCIKLIKKDYYYYIRIHGQQNIKIYITKNALLKSVEKYW